MTFCYNAPHLMLEIINDIIGLALMSPSPSLFLHEDHFLWHPYTFFQGNPFGLERNYLSLYLSSNVALLFYDSSLNNRGRQFLVDIWTYWTEIKKFKLNVPKILEKSVSTLGNQRKHKTSISHYFLECSISRNIKIVNTKYKLSLRIGVFSMSNSLFLKN